MSGDQDGHGGLYRGGAAGVLQEEGGGGAGIFQETGQAGAGHAVQVQGRETKVSPHLYL